MGQIQPRSFVIHSLRLLFCYKQSSLDRGRRFCKAWDIYFSGLYRKGVPAPALKASVLVSSWGQFVNVVLWLCSRRICGTRRKKVKSRSTQETASPHYAEVLRSRPSVREWARSKPAVPPPSPRMWGKVALALNEVGKINGEGEPSSRTCGHGVSPHRNPRPGFTHGLWFWEPQATKLGSWVLTPRGT